MRMQEAFPSKYLKSEDFPYPTPVQIYGARIEEVGSNKDKKLILFFRGQQKGLVLNKTNWSVLARLLGSDDSDQWGGKYVEIYTEMVPFKGEMVPGLRLRAVTPGVQINGQAAAATPPQPRQAPAPQAPPPPQQTAPPWAPTDTVDETGIEQETVVPHHIQQIRQDKPPF